MWKNEKVNKQRGEGLPWNWGTKVASGNQLQLRWVVPMLCASGLTSPWFAMIGKGLCWEKHGKIRFSTRKRCACYFCLSVCWRLLLKRGDLERSMNTFSVHKVGNGKGTIHSCQRFSQAKLRAAAFCWAMSNQPILWYECTGVALRLQGWNQQSSIKLLTQPQKVAAHIKWKTTTSENNGHVSVTSETSSQIVAYWYTQ